MSELAPTQALQDRGGHGAPCLAASAQATLGDRRGGQGPGGPQPPSTSLSHGPVPRTGRFGGTARAPELVAAGAGGHGWVRPPVRACPGQGSAPAPSPRPVSPGQGHHDPAELVLCHLGWLGEVLGVLPPAPPRPPPPGGKRASPGTALGLGAAGDTELGGSGLRAVGFRAAAAPACSGQLGVKHCICMPGCRACPLSLLLRPPQRLTVTLSSHTRRALQCLTGEDLLYSLSF